MSFWENKYSIDRRYFLSYMFLPLGARKPPQGTPHCCSPLANPGQNGDSQFSCSHFFFNDGKQLGIF